MINFLIMILVFPTITYCSNIKTIEGKYDYIENNDIPVNIIVDLTKTGQVIDKNFYGSHLNSYSAMPTKEIVNELQIGKIRVGGNEFDVNNWKTNKTIMQSGETRDLISFEQIVKKLDEYNVSGIFQINLTGYMPELVGTNFIAKNTFTANSAYEMVQYLNGKKKLNIVDFSLGNEFSIWNETHNEIWPTKDAIAADDYIDRYIQFAIAIRSAQEQVNGNPNSIKIWGPEISSSWLDWNTGNFSNDCQWTEIKGQVSCLYGKGKFDNFLPYFFDKLKSAEENIVLNPKKYKLLDYVSIHYYPNFRTDINDPFSIITNSDGKQLVEEMLESTRLFNDPTFINTIDISSYINSSPNILGRVKEWMRTYYPDAKLAINEFSVDSDYRTNTYHPIIRPLFLADLIGIFTKENIAFFNQFLLSSDPHSNSPWSMVEGKVKKDLFYMYKLFTNNFKGTVVSVEDNLDDTLNAYATIQEDIINLAIVNKNPVEKLVKIYIKDVINNKITTYTAPAWSTSILKLVKHPDDANKTFSILQFGAAEMGIPIDETYRKKI